MTATVYVVVEDDEADSMTGRVLRWIVLDHHETVADADEHADAVAHAEHERTGVEPAELDA